jgi:hypothetical protein
MDDLFKTNVAYSGMIWGVATQWKTDIAASVLLNYLSQVHLQPTVQLSQVSWNRRPLRRWLDAEFRNSIAPAYALLMLSADEAIFTPETATAVVPHIIFAMEKTESPLLRHVGLKIAYIIKESLTNITNDVRDQLLPALHSATFGNILGDIITPGDTSPDRFIHPERDLHYLEILFALAKSKYLLSQLRQGRYDHIQRCISISKALHTPSRNVEGYKELSLRLVLIFARVACAADDFDWPEWDIWFVERPDNQALLAKKAWKYPRILPDVVPLLIAFTSKMLSSLDDVSDDGLKKLDKDIMIAVLDDISYQVQKVADARMDVDEMQQNALKVLRARVVNSRDELLKKFGAVVESKPSSVVYY